MWSIGERLERGEDGGQQVEERIGQLELGSSRLITGFSSSTSAASFSNLSLEKVDQLTVQQSE